ncbi:MAG TPA: VOC family protein [Candidatus Saccharimonadales bacterium]|jgi:catechol 2,3-dioxygenase-like lactoylglutathione lyase family enzyme|nr:VOC family protein [Candidatus Saccharimonadales bacterium]
MLSDNNVCAVLAVKDMDAAKQFYGEVLGLEAGEEDPSGIFYKSGNGGVFVYQSQFAGTNQATAAAWSVQDVEGAVEELKGKGVSFEHYDNMPGVEMSGDVHIMGDTKAAWFKDPDGNILNIVNKMA